MNLKPIGSNMTELKLADKPCEECGQDEGCDENRDVRVLFSYSTPVAYSVLKPSGARLYFKTAQFYSRTTSKHITKWLAGNEAERVEQYVIDDVVDGNGH